MRLEKHFTIALFYSVLTLGMFFAMQYIFAWTNPTLSPPSGNVSPPINEGTTAQVKDGSLGISGNLTAPIFYDINNTGYYIDPAGTSKFNTVNLGGVGRSSWPVDTDTRCDSSGQCSQVCVGSDCRSSWPSTEGLFDLVYGQHSSGQCSSLGGTVKYAGSVKVCSFSGGSCPEGWANYYYWSTTSSVSGSTQNCLSNYTPWTGPQSCSTGSHSWSNTQLESCTFCKICNNPDYWTCNEQETIYANYVEVGCY